MFEATEVYELYDMLYFSSLLTSMFTFILTQCTFLYKG